MVEGYSSVFILVDSNTEKYCLHLLPDKLREKDIIIIPAGEENKNLASCTKILHILTGKNADRHALLVNLGGGMITDLGGFAASTYKRGIDFFNIPTSLLGMVDAAIGGKTGINLENFKNQLGTFQIAKKVIINDVFLDTLPEAEFKSAYAEVLKYALIADKEMWDSLEAIPESSKGMLDIIKRCINIKNEITLSDPHEMAERKLLNFGHTVGHAIEGLSQLKNKPVLHGDAIAAGMMVESYLSIAKGELSEPEFIEILSKIKLFCNPANVDDFSIEELLGFMKQDKKNYHSEMRFTLLKSIGNGIFDIGISEEEIAEAIGIVLK